MVRKVISRLSLKLMKLSSPTRGLGAIGSETEEAETEIETDTEEAGVIEEEEAVGHRKKRNSPTIRVKLVNSRR